MSVQRRVPFYVAPRTGAWIETVRSRRQVNIFLSRPVRARGLKPELDPLVKCVLCRAPYGRVD